MFEPVFESLQKTTEATIKGQQDLFKKWVGQWTNIPTGVMPGVMASPMPYGDQALKFQKQWAETVSSLIRQQQKVVEAQFSAGLKAIEEAFRLAEAKDFEELRCKTVELWQKTFESLRRTYEAQIKDIQATLTAWAEFVAKGAA
jgi:hypothetical protein